MSRDRRKRLGSSTAAVKASAVSWPTPRMLIDCRCEGQCGELADTPNAHQPAASVGCPNHPSYVAVDRHDSGEHGGTRRNQTPHGGGQAGDALARAERLLDEGGAERTRQSNAEHHGKTADLVLQSDPLTYQLLASDDQRADSVRRQRLHMNGLEEAGAGEMRQATCVVAVGLVRRQRLQRLIRLPALDADDGQPKFVKPW